MVLGGKDWDALLAACWDGVGLLNPGQSKIHENCTVGAYTAARGNNKFLSNNGCNHVFCSFFIGVH